MAVFKYNEKVRVSKDEDVYLTIVHPKVGTASYSLVDIPGDNDLETTNEAKLLMGKGEPLLSERTVIYTKAVNIDENNSNVEIQYFINEKLVVDHTNPKSIDPSPQIKINLTFIDS